MQLSRRESYDRSSMSTGTRPVDVNFIVFDLTTYFVLSFGIVLWEIWSRGFPFEQYRFGFEMDDVVGRGERLVVPDNCP